MAVDYLTLITGEHRDRPLFAAVVEALTKPIGQVVDLESGLVDDFDLDGALGAQLDAVGLWVGITRSVPQPIAGVYFTWDDPQPSAAPTLGSAAGGALAATTYYARVTLVTAAGESLPSAEASLAVAANSVLTVASPAAVPAVTGYNVYVGTASGGETKQNAAPINIGTNWTEPTTGLVSGAALPTKSVGTGVGWTQGTWQGPYDPSTGLVSIGDEDFRLLIRARIMRNSWDGSLAQMYSIYQYLFGAAAIKIQDNYDMSMVVIYDTGALSPLQQALLTNGLLGLKPAGVRVTYLSSSSSPLFSWNMAQPNFQGWNGTSVWSS